MVVMLGGMAAAFAFVLHRLPPAVSLADALAVGGALGKMKVIDFAPRFDTRYTFWAGITGGLFVQLAYFGTDQSQVQRYLTGSPLAESRLGLMFNGIVKLPMQFGILAVGLLLFVFYQFHQPPIFFNAARAGARRGERARPRAARRRARSGTPPATRRAPPATTALVDARHAGRRRAHRRRRSARCATRPRTPTRCAKRAIALIGQSRARAETKDQDYIFLRFVLAEFPSGLVGLLIAVILCAAMSATASALNSLGTTSVVDFYKRSVRAGADDAHYLRVAKFFTVVLGRGGRRLRHRRLAVREPDPGGEHPRLDLLRADARRVPGRILHEGARAERPRSSRSWWRRRRWWRCGWDRRSDFFGTTSSAARSSSQSRSARRCLALDEPDDVALEIAEQRHDDAVRTRVRGTIVWAPSVCALSSVASMSGTCT